MLRIVICEDEEKDLAYIRKAVGTYCAGQPEYGFQVEEFSNPSDMLDALEQGAVWDIALLDVYLPGLLGTEIAGDLRERLKHLGIIFLTTSTDHAVDAFALGAVHYLLKPFTYAQLEEALNRALTDCERKERQSIALCMENGAASTVMLGEILYIETLNRSRVVHTTSGDYAEHRQSLTALFNQLNQLSPGQFINPYRGYIVNQDAIRMITARDIVLRNEVKIPVKEGNFREIRDNFFQWMFARQAGQGDVT